MADLLEEEEIEREIADVPPIKWEKFPPERSRYEQRMGGVIIQKASGRRWLLFLLVSVLACLIGLAVMSINSYLAIPALGVVVAVVPKRRQLKFNPKFVNAWERQEGLPQTDYSKYGVKPKPITDENAMLRLCACEAPCTEER